MVRSSHMKQTSHFQLNQYEASDRILHGDFNSDNQKIDAALAAAGNCRVAAGSYTGTGTYGQNNPCSLTFDFKPLLVFLDTGVMDPYNSIPVHYILRYPASTMGYSLNALGGAAWTEQGVSWYNKDAASQLNVKDRTYHYLAIGK